MTTESTPNLALSGTSSTGLVLSNEAMEMAFRMAELMAGGRATVPKHLQGSPADCMAVTLQALQWNMSPFAVAQKTHLVNGTLGYEAQLVNAVLQSTGAITGEFEYEFQGNGEDLQCRVGAIPRGKQAVTWGEWLAVRNVTTKNSPLWKTNPKQQLAYLQVKNWARLYKPGAILGVYTPDELEPLAGGEKFMGQADVVPPAPSAPKFYDAAEFDKNFPVWSKAIAAGKKTPGDVIATVETKGLLTEEQKAKVLSVKKAEVPKQEATDVQPKGEPAPTYAQVADSINQCQSLEELDAMDALIGAVENPEHRSELATLVAQRKNEIPF
ncbi:MAG: recombinase RecT [Xenophilus sp.]